MRKSLILILVTVVLSGTVLVTGGCNSEAKTDALIGGAIGAGIGQAVGRDTEATLIGGAVGAGAGWLYGNSQDKKKAEQQRQFEEAAAQQAAESNVTTVMVTNSNGSQTPVRLVRDGDTWIGPKGEVYTTMPTEEQLRKVYGF